jgi:Fe-S oxidoreductase
MPLEPRSGRGDWAEGLDVKHVKNNPAEVLFHSGCRFSYDRSLWPVIRGAINIFQKAGVDIGIMGKDESCCGARAHDMGFKEDFTGCAENLINTYREAGVKTVVTSCANGFHAFTRLSPRLGEHFEVFHTVQYIDRLINEERLKLSKPIPLRVTYHDPCHLGRQGEPYVPWNGKEKKIRNQIVVYEPRKPRYNGAWGVYDPPRNIIRSESGSTPGVAAREVAPGRDTPSSPGGRPHRG